MTQEELNEVKKAYDLEAKDTNVTDATATYVAALEAENKKYSDWWHEAYKENETLKDTIAKLQAEISHYRDALTYELNRNK